MKLLEFEIADEPKYVFELDDSLKRPVLTRLSSLAAITLQLRKQMCDLKKKYVKGN